MKLLYLSCMYVVIKCSGFKDFISLQRLDIFDRAVTSFDIRLHCLTITALVLLDKRIADIIKGVGLDDLWWDACSKNC